MPWSGKAENDKVGVVALLLLGMTGVDSGSLSLLRLETTDFSTLA
jgi:hypothetical protein